MKQAIKHLNDIRDLDVAPWEPWEAREDPHAFETLQKMEEQLRKSMVNAPSSGNCVGGMAIIDHRSSATLSS